MERKVLVFVSVLIIVFAVFRFFEVNSPTAQPSRGRSLSFPLDINHASSSELERLPGIGPKTARAIIEYRRANGPFQSPDDLQNVKGIGRKKFELIKGRIAVNH